MTSSEKKAAQSHSAQAPEFQHTEDELRYVADILRALNNPALGASVGVGGEIEVFWCDRVMGVIALDDSDDLQSWMYYPLAKRNNDPI